MDYPIAERFYSVQGEGLHSGRAAYFIRLFGCCVKCPWCDTVDSWHGTPAEILSAAALADAAAQAGAEMAVITGGEPCMYDISELVGALHARKIKVHLETSGVLEIPEKNAALDWVAVSPKLFSKPLFASLARADELKYVVGFASELAEYAAFTEFAANAQAVWLHPEWGKRADADLLVALCEFVKERRGKYRAGWQLHKNYFVR